MSVERPHTISLPDFPPSDVEYHPAAVDAKDVTQKWSAEWEMSLLHHDISALETLFHKDCWWRDMLALSWDFRTVHGLNDIRTYINRNLPTSQLRNIRLRETGQFKPSMQNAAPGVQWIESMFGFETDLGRGSGVFRLVQDGHAQWKAYMMYTVLQGLKSFEERCHFNRPHGGSNSLVGGAMKGNWEERRQRQKEFVDSEPTVVVIGAGQAGLSIGARLQQLGVSTLIVDRNERVGDNWRSRYRTLVTHDPVHYCHMAYLPFPANWPMFTAKDKLADWFEAYASRMELNVWLSTTLQSAAYEDQIGTWTVKLRRGDGSTRVFHPRHVVFCTGHAGEARIPTFPGQGKFCGKVYHTSQHQDASLSRDVQGKNVVVVESGNSGHDISQNYYENGANVTMLQRGGTYVISAQKGLYMLHKGLYEENGPSTEDADIYGQSLPIPVQFALNVSATERIAAIERQQNDGLTKAGFKLDFGQEGDGIYRKYITKRGGYYIDVGCSQLIIDGSIKVQQSLGGIKEFDVDGLVLADGTKLQADVVVLATGYDNMRTTARKIMGDKVADRLNDAWDLDAEGEVNAIWKFSGHPGFWYMGGSLALCRIYSKLVGLQIKAIEEGLFSQKDLATQTFTHGARYNALRNSREVRPFVVLQRCDDVYFRSWS